MNHGRIVLVYGCSIGANQAAFAENTRGLKRVDDRPVLNGIVHFFKNGGRWAMRRENTDRRKNFTTGMSDGPNASIWEKILLVLAKAGGQPEPR